MSATVGVMRNAAEGSGTNKQDNLKDSGWSAKIWTYETRKQRGSVYVHHDKKGLSRLYN